MRYFHNNKHINIQVIPRPSCSCQCRQDMSNYAPRCYTLISSRCYHLLLLPCKIILHVIIYLLVYSKLTVTCIDTYVYNILLMYIKSTTLALYYLMYIYVPMCIFVYIHLCMIGRVWLQRTPGVQREHTRMLQAAHGLRSQ